MAHVTPPYFFDEFLGPVKRREPTPRERALGLTLKDLDWLHTLYYASHDARMDARIHGFPMRVERLLITPAGQPALPLAGAFVMSPTPDAGKAVLYTPYGGLEVFDNHAALLADVTARLRQPEQRTDLLQFVSLGDQKALSTSTRLTLTTAVIPGAVMPDQQQAIHTAQVHNVIAMLGELRKLPDLPDMLDKLLGIMARPYFPDVEQRDTRVDFFSRASPEEDSRWVDSVPLREALLRFYARHAWPADQTHTYTNPGRDFRALTDAQRAQDQQRWDNIIEHTSGILSKLLNHLLQTFWHEDFNGGGQSRLHFCARVMSQKFRADLLFKHQDMILSSAEMQKLRSMALAQQAASGDLSIEKVRIHAPFQHFVDLAGTLMISNAHAYLYTQSRGLQVLGDLNDLKDTLVSMLKATGHEDELLNFLSLDERSLFIAMDQVHVSGQPILGNVFEAMVEDIVAKQADNLEYALGLYRCSSGSVNLAALLDSALDVRTMLDSQLLEQDAGGRWSVHPITQGNGRPTTVQAEKAKLQLQRLQAVEAALVEEQASHPTLRDLATQALEAELRKGLLSLKACEVYINTYASAAEEREERLPQASSSLVEHFIARLVRQAGPVGASTHTGVYGPRHQGAAFQLHNLTTVEVDALIDRALGTFAQQTLGALPGMLVKNNLAHLSHGLLQGLDGEVQLRGVAKNLPPRALVLLHSSLQPDGMSRLTRHGLDGFIPDAFSLTLHPDNGADLQRLANCFVLTERGGLDPDHSGTAVLWTPARGYETFASITRLRDILTLRLQDPRQRLHLLENLPISQRVPHRSWQLGPLQRIDEHLLHDRQHSYSDATRDEIDHLLSLRLSPTRFQECVDALIRRAPPSNLPRAIAMARALINQQALPVWLGMAAPAEQILHAELVEQYRISAPDERDYLHSVTPLREHVFDRLSELLDARFPRQALNPNNVLIPGRVELAGNTQTLTDFAMRHLPTLRADDIRPRSSTGDPLPATLDGSAIEQLIRQVDVESFYGQWLNTHLKGPGEQARTRRQLFCRQLPWQVLQYAHEQTLDERLSASAWGFIRQIFDMPDALARATVHGVTALVRPLELIATQGASRVRALGCYLIGPKPEATGPLVLYAPYSPDHLLKEFANETALLQAFAAPGTLQQWVIGQLEPAHQATYRNLLSQQWTQGPSEIRFGANAIAGNVLDQLFKDNCEMLLRMLGSQFSASGKNYWDAVTSLLTKGIAAGVRFMAGKLVYPLTVWRSYALFKTSAEDLQQHRWQHALKTFAGGVAELASLRKALDKLFPEPPPATHPVPLEQWLQDAPPAATTFAALDMTAPERTHLHVFENHDVALDTLTQSALTQVYRDKIGARDYVPVAGKVYSVKRAGEYWRLSSDDHLGPYVRLTPRGEWVLDLGLLNPRYGKTLSRYASQARAYLSEREGINIEAVGMPAIRALSSWKAQCIDEALNVATYYAVNCKRNIQHFGGRRDPVSRTGLFFAELFGVPHLTLSQLQRIEKRVDDVLDELTNHTLTSPNSMRFVSGSHRQNPHTSFAFTLPDDRDHKIYLVERFFDPRMDHYQPYLTTPFNLSAHARATTLIHEITHIRSSTEDLVYLDSMRPFVDLIDGDCQGGQTLKTELCGLRANALSLLTPTEMLFKTLDDLSGGYEDFGSSQGTSLQRSKVLSTTGVRTLAEARKVFMTNEDKRIDTILANADSLTFLISEIGRALDAGA